jgi:LemA protein
MFDNPLLWIIIGVGVVAILVLFAVVVYNRLIGRRVEKDNAWSQIDVQLKRRYDLIPNLVETVKGYAKHEQETLERVIKARNQALQAPTVSEKAVAEQQLTTAVRGLLAIAEAYPDLKANQNFLSLQEELTATENRIGFARQHYNDVVSQYNTALLTFPANIVGSMFGFRPADFFQVEAAEAAAVREAPKVKF